ncbi:MULTISPECIES: PH domain-containing protein [Bacillus]|uniref:PH domain-containing protein n=1 Tax=Bacillus TaxID=1386 RepID=UPI000D30618F
MGFFSLKVVCGVCDNKVGLNRYKVKKSNAWVCPDCLKAAGGMTVVPVNKVTIEEIKVMIEEKKAVIDARTEKIAENPMSTAEGMYQYCVDNNFGSGYNEKWGLKHFGVLEKNLMQAEEVLMTFIGLHNYESATKHDRNFAYAITNKRIMFGQNSLTGEKFKSVAYEKINDIKFEKGLLFGVLTIDTPQEKFNISLEKDSATAINKNVHQVLDSLKNSTTETQPVSTAVISVADELKKFKELLDIGVITEEEFNAKKKQLLNL